MSTNCVAVPKTLFLFPLLHRPMVGLYLFQPLN